MFLKKVIARARYARKSYILSWRKKKMDCPYEQKAQYFCPSQYFPVVINDQLSEEKKLTIYCTVIIVKFHFFF